VYAFETNIQAQTVRGLNTAASNLLFEGFPAPRQPKVMPVATHKKTAEERFAQALDSRRAAIESGNFASVWKSFSRRKKAEMAKAGMSQDGFMRLQNLTYRVDSAAKQTVLKTKIDSATEMLVLIKQSQTNRPDIFVKQLWVYQDDEWKLDDEEKRAAVPNAEPTTPSVKPVTDSPPASGKPSPASLPGMSN
jgi:hypothetical protein